MAIEAGQTGTLAINADSGNVLAGRTYEFVPRNWRRGANIRVAAVAALAASTSCTASLKVDSNAVSDKASVPYDSVARGVRMIDDVIMETWAGPGARLFLNFNSGAVSAVAPGVNWKVVLDPA